ncbi:MAG: Glu/Leu/Phe/Val family dehydrogenase [Chitinophagales bacterium]
MGVFDNREFDNHEHVSFCCDEKSGLKAIIAIHSTAFPRKACGGGCRFYPYPDLDAALTDVLRLSKAMTYKNAIAGLPAGGGKSVIIGDPRKDKSEALFEAFGEFVERLNGRYITAEDVGTTPQDMQIISRKTYWVTGLPGGSGDTSPATGYGIHCAMLAAAEYKLKRKIQSVAFQGFGNVGRYTANHLVKEGVKIYVADVNEEAVKLAVDKYGATAVSLDEIYSLDVDILAPCALGGVLNDTTIPQIKAPIICGGANNQLAKSHHGKMLQNQGILYVPDYVANAGGTIIGAAPLLEKTEEQAMQQVAEIYDNCLKVLSLAEEKGITTEEASSIMAHEIIKKYAK